MKFLVRHWRILLILILLVGVPVIIYSYGIHIPIVEKAITGECRNIYCADYEFICCGEKLDHESYVSIRTETSYWQCPTTATKCVISFDFVAIGSTGCAVRDHRIQWFMDEFYCYDEKIYYDSEISMEPGEYAYGNGADISYKVYTKRLCWCGDAACDCGVTGIPVQSASGCSFVTNKDVYDANGNLKQDVVEGQDFQITVPMGTCYLSYKGRHHCGDTCEYCFSDEDCAVLYPLKYEWMGKTYGAECKSGKVILYGCRKYGEEPTEEDTTILPGESEPWIEYGSRCDSIKTITVQCCPYTDSCGPNAFCDPETYTCKSEEEVECDWDWECGQAQECTYRDNKPVIQGKLCKDHKCVLETVREVDCCYDTDCSSGYYCDDDYSCKEKVIEKQACPYEYECCVREELYRDRPCTEDKICCPDHTCQVSCEDEVDGDGIVDECDIICGSFLKDMGCHFTRPFKEAWCRFMLWLSGILIWIVLGFVIFIGLIIALFALKERLRR